MKTIIHKADTRGQANYGWLETRYTFSFANYYNPDRVNFGTLRVINDDCIDGGQGFGKHPHDNMEIITIILEGELEHMDSMGHKMKLKKDEVQVMTAGTGIFHSEYNSLPDTKLKLFQIWVFPSKHNLTPRYDQKYFSPEERKNSWQQIVAPKANGALLINQNAYFSRVTLDAESKIEYNLKDNNNGIYLLLVEGKGNVNDIELERRDGIGIWETENIQFSAKEKSELLLMEIPMR